MIRRFAILFGLVLVLLAALWEVPRRLDWAAWRADLAWLATQRLGRIVYLSGPVRLTLLPQPVIEAEGVELGGAEGDVGLKAQALRLRLGWGALLAGRLEPREIALVGADLRLPWPPAPNFSLRPPSWMTVLSAEIERGRLTMGPLTLEGIDATITTGGPTEALLAKGRFSWRGQAVSFDANIGRPGWDAVAPMELNLRQGETALNTRGALLPEGGYEGQLSLSGNDLSQLLPGPVQPFRARGRLAVSADLLSADDLSIDLGGAPAKGAATLRLSPSLRLDLALAASRLDLDGWVAALRRAGTRPFPVGLDLSAEQANFAGLAIRRLRASALVSGGKVSISDFSALLPGDTRVAGSGEAETGTPPAPGQPGAAPVPPPAERLTLDLRLDGSDWRSTLAAMGYPLTGIDPARLKEGEARLNLVATPGQVAFSDLNAQIDGTRLSGTGVVRFGARPALGLGLTLDTLDLARLWPAGMDRAGFLALFAGFDANLRLNAEKLAWGGRSLNGAGLDAALENGRLTLRRLAGELSGAQVSLSGAAQLPGGNNPLRLADVVLEANAPLAGEPMALLPGEWPRLASFTDDPLALRVTAAGPLEQLQGRVSLELGSLRAELQGTGDILGRRGNATLTLRHPGLTRLLGEVMGPGTGDWLGDGSLALIAPLAITPTSLSTEYLDLTAGSLKANGAVSLVLDGVRPRLTGRLAMERLQLSGFDPASRDPLTIGDLRLLDADLALTAGRATLPGLPPLEDAAGSLRLTDGALSIADGKGRFSGGSIGFGGGITPGADTPRSQMTLNLTDVVLDGGFFDTPLDISGGRLSGSVTLSALGYSPAAMVASLSGDLRLSLRDGMLEGVDLPALAVAADRPALADAEAGLRAALSLGRTNLSSFDLQARVEQGRVSLGPTRLSLADGQTGDVTGEVDLPRRTIDLRLATRFGEAPDLALRLTGPLDRPRRLPELAPWLRWKAAQ
ncbi:AsmA family protein [Acetobacteraceae bacterium H6797]|nr:AsmA family protein [Acetobacteraceae bacterium H6797]